MAPGRSLSRTSGSQSSQTGIDSPNGVGQPKKKGGRKRAQNLILREHLECGAPRPRIEIPVGKLRPLEDWSDQWVAELGIICKKNIPITAHCWKDVTIEQREVLYQKVLASFDVDMTQDHVVAAVNDSMKDRFKELRHSFHKHYLSIPDGSDKRANCPKTIKQEDWEAICDWFESDKFKKMSTRNKANREKLNVNHRGGCKSFVRHRHEQKDPVTGEEQNRVDFYRTMHWNNTKGWVAPEAFETYDKMLELRSQPVEENSRAMNDGEIDDKVLGVRSGYVRGLGHGEVAPSRRVGVGVGTNQQEMNQLRTRAEEVETNLEELRNWRGTTEEASNTQQQMINTQQQQIDAQNQKLAEQEQFLNFLKAKFGFN